MDRSESGDSTAVAAASAEARPVAAATEDLEAEAEAAVRPARHHQEGWMKPDPVVRIVHNSKKATIRQHYYPEGGWGWVVVAATTAATAVGHGVQMAVAGVLPVQPHYWIASGRQLHARGTCCVRCPIRTPTPLDFIPYPSLT